MLPKRSLPFAPDYSAFLRLVQVLLTVIVLVMLASFFTWTDNVAVTRAAKIVARVAMTGAAYGVYRLILARGAVDSFRWQHSLAPLLYGAYLLLGVASLLWSTNPGYSLLQLVMDVASLVFAYFFVKCFLLLEAFFPARSVLLSQVLGTASFWLVLLFVVGLVVAPEVFGRLTHGAAEIRLGGYFINPNELGMLCVVCLSCLWLGLYRGHRPVLTALQMAPVLAALVLTGSRSSLVGFLLIVGFHIWQARSTRLKLALATATLLALPLVGQLFIKQGGLDEVLNLTGRLPFWHALLTEGLPKEPLLGYGFMRIAYGDYFQSAHTYAAQMTHNTFIQVLLNLGLVGFAIVLAQLAFTLRGFAAYPTHEGRLLLLGIFLPILINSFTEFGIFGLSNYGILFYQLLIFLISLRYNPRLSTPEQLFLKRMRPELALAG
ncbi:O-antigen ligase family protein [Hymenobacter sp. BT683]|uniref:O-antigen ligase family protein n=1 Tax=Hymenobacter jeongseonensis TaxID=2791027 RepID=A0ABS0IMR6_9BACT|nr:O-antigen ligase family protein [Hymenobacter jeongseonensis]MBF9239664.1 O-antigen ligase family protein [Hymenobacter jeongseonensis]